MAGKYIHFRSGEHYAFLEVDPSMARRITEVRGQKKMRELVFSVAAEIMLLCGQMTPLLFKFKDVDGDELSKDLLRMAAYPVPPSQIHFVR